MCKRKIDRGLSYACGDWPGDNEFGCGQFFCGKHMSAYEDEAGDYHQACDVCAYNMTHQAQEWKPTYPKKPDRNVWLRWKLKHSSWQRWRDENPEAVRRIKEIIDG
jgi:hypothetical protein